MKRIALLLCLLLPGMVAAETITPARPTVAEYKARTAKATYWVDTLADLQNIPADELSEGRVYSTRGHTTETDNGGMRFVWFATGLSADGGEDSPLRIAGPNGADDFFRAADGGQGLVTGRAAGYGGDFCLVANWPFNTIDNGVSTAICMGGGSSLPNHIGNTGKPLGTDYTPSGWADDSGYVDNFAGITVLAGGYDNILNQVAGVIMGGGHNFVKYHADGHSIIGGGSYNVIYGGRSGIFGGLANSINGASTSQAFIGGGYDNTIGNSCTGAAIVGGSGNGVNAGSGFALAHGSSNEITATAGIALGQSNTLTAPYSIVVGLQNTSTIGASGYTACFGRENTAQDDYSLTFGRGAETLAPYSLTAGRTTLHSGGISQSIDCIQQVRTSGSPALTNLADSIVVPAGKRSMGVGTIYLSALRDGSADGNNDSNYAWSAWRQDFSFLSDGSNYRISKVGTTVTSGTIDFDTAIYDGITITTPPAVAASSGQLRVQVTGVDGVAINWVARINMVFQAVQ